MNLSEAQKTEIQILLKEFVTKFPSQAKACDHIKDCSEATVIQMLKGNWEAISEAKWRTVGKQIGWSEALEDELQMVETLSFATFLTFYADARDYGNMYAIAAPCGYGKSYTSKWFKGNSRNVFHIQCQRHWSRKWFLRKILELAGKDWQGMDVTELMDTLIKELYKLQKPVIIFDEVHKLNDNNLLFIIELYNELHGKCGIVIQGNNALKLRFKKAMNSNKVGFEDVFSRAGRKWLEVNPCNHDEIKKICVANGITLPMQVNEVYNNYVGSAHDLRVVRTKIHAFKQRVETEGKNAAQ